jgi:ABC-2 type transport system ATP-binding protein
MSGQVAVNIEHVSKQFRLHHERHSSLKERILHPNREPSETFWALQDIDFAVKEGETVGILGRNGSGKSTLLKCVAGILQPTSGRVLVRGQLAALLELGAGFQPELSGRDNVFLNASLLGLSTKEVERRFDAIVAFAELENFIDNQVKFYSSGMYVRLGFAVAVNVDPDVLIVDEVLAVGDENFQRKCIERIKQFQAEGRTILFVTHAPDLVRGICDRAVVLGKGKMIGMGTPGEAIRAFREHLLSTGGVLEPSLAAAAMDLGAAPSTTSPITITGVELQHPGTGTRDYMLPGEPLTIRVAFDALEPISDVVFSVVIQNNEGSLIYASDTEIEGKHFDAAEGDGLAVFYFHDIPLLDGTFSISLGIRNRSGGVVYDWREQQCRFQVMNPGRSTGIVSLGMESVIAMRPQEAV